MVFEVVVLEVVFGGGQEPVAKAYHVPVEGSRMMQGSGKFKERRGVLAVLGGVVAVVVVVVVVVVSVTEVWSAMMVVVRRGGRRRVRKT